MTPKRSELSNLEIVSSLTHKLHFPEPTDSEETEISPSVDERHMHQITSPSHSTDISIKSALICEKKKERRKSY